MPLRRSSAWNTLGTLEVNRRSIRHLSKECVVLAVFLAACSSARETSPTPGPDAAAIDGGGDPSQEAGAQGCGCADYGTPSAVGSLPAPLAETSGLAASRKNPGVLYAHNDSGDTARIFALDDKGGALGEITIGGASAVDWEDIAVGPCNGGSCVWIGDVGDNDENRTDYALYAIDEPELGGKPFAKTTIHARRYPFSYPDGKWNCESLLVHPTTGEIFLVTKKATIEAGVYRFPANLTPDTPVVLEKVGVAKGTMGSLVTGGDISPCGDRILLRTYLSLLEYRIPSSGTVASALGSEPRSVPVASEPQGEAVAFGADGRGYFTAPEGAGASLSFTGCQ